MESDSKLKKIGIGIKLFLAWLFTLLLFGILGMMLVRGPILFLQEFSYSGKGTVEKVKSVHGGYDLYLSSKEEFHWILNRPEPSVGDEFYKEKYSFRYMVNGKNRTDKEHVLTLISIPIPYRAAFILLVAMLIFQTVFYWIYKKSPPVAFLEAFWEKTYKKMASVITMYVLPVLFLWYVIDFFVVDLFL